MATREQHRKRPNRSSKWCPKALRLALYLRDGFTCQYCGKDLHGADPRDYGLDHLRPQSARPGYHAPRNLVTACFPCNRGRGVRPWRRYATAGAVARIVQATRKGLGRYMVQARALLATGASWGEVLKSAV